MDVMPILPETEVEAMAALHLGRLLFVFGRMELDLGQALVQAQPAEDAERAILRIEQLPFGEKLREFETLALRRHADDAPLRARWQRWFAAAHALRKLRNDFAHGSWGFQNMQQQIVHVSHLPGSPNQTEVRYSLAGFAARVVEAEDIAEEFCALTELSRAG
ncbi:hypothetical protein ACI48D_00450 [Massilia sp. LXY-6]|uniref:hypothetical protein n=1 Tax=Massilia sp. LXY-6 TaxID=3379823 RepID=UPI003EE1FD0E